MTTIEFELGNYEPNTMFKVDNCAAVRYTATNELVIQVQSENGTWEKKIIYFKHKNDFFKLLKNSNFKQELIEYLKDDDIE